MSETQFYISVAVMPITTIVIVLVGVLLNNSNMNSRMNDVMARLSDLRSDFGHRLDSAEAKLDRLTRVEAHLGIK